jgi:hypothetical protein
MYIYIYIYKTSTDILSVIHSMKEIVFNYMHCPIRLSFKNQVLLIIGTKVLFICLNVIR